MDTVKIGKFLKELRKEQGLTQEQLGEKLGVTNKTISRWETGTYMPPVESLAMLSDIYGISINEIVSGQKLAKEEFTSAAEENLSDALRLSENDLRRTEKYLTAAMILSTVVAMIIIVIMPSSDSMVLNIAVILLIVCLLFITNSVNIAALVMNKERFGKK